MSYSRLLNAVVIILLFISCSSPQHLADEQEQKQDQETVSVNDIQRPVFYDVDTPEAFRNAQNKNTRTITGQPGVNYWQNEASYSIHANLDPEIKPLRAQLISHI